MLDFRIAHYRLFQGKKSHFLELTSSFSDNQSVRPQQILCTSLQGCKCQNMYPLPPVQFKQGFPNVLAGGLQQISGTVSKARKINLWNEEATTVY